MIELNYLRVGNVRSHVCPCVIQTVHKYWRIEDGLFGPVLYLKGTPSRLGFVHHPPTTTFALATDFALKHTLQHGNEPLPSFEGCGLKFKCLNLLRNTHPAASAPPLSIGMWLKFAQRRNGGGRYMRGDPEYGRPSQYVQKTNHDERRRSFSSFFHSFHWNWLLILSHRPPPCPMPAYIDDT